MLDTQPTSAPPEKPFAGLTTIYFASPDKRMFFRQNSPTGGTYLECWVAGNDFCHTLATIESLTPAHLVAWMEVKQLQPSTQEIYESYLFQLFRDIEAKRVKKNQEKQRIYDESHKSLLA